MYISPRRRRRILEAHRLRQEGHSLRAIAQFLDVSAATVHADLKLLETHWSDLVEQAADDLLLNQINQLERRLVKVLERNPFDVFDRYVVSLGEGYFRAWTDTLSATDIVRVQQAHTAEIALLFRETRRAIQDLHRRAGQRRDLAAQSDSDREPDYPAEELTDPPSPGEELLIQQRRDDRARTQAEFLPDAPDSLNIPEHPEPASAQPAKENLQTGPPEKISPEQPEHPPGDAPEDSPEHLPVAPKTMLQAIHDEIVADNPLLKSKNEDELIAFLDQLALQVQPEDPTEPPIPIYTDAAGS